MVRLTLEEMHEALLEILTEFDRVCRKYGLRYSLAAGTLLGAVRHKGFIPWDDDVDVYMPRPDYEKFIELVAGGGVLPEYMSLSPDRGKGTYYCFAKILDSRYPLKCSNHIEVKYLYLDIFPVDGVPADKKERDKMYKKEKVWVYLAGICQWYTIDRWWGFIEYIFGFWLYIFVNLFIGRKRAVKKMNEYAAKYPYETSELAAFHNFGLSCEALPRQAYEDLQEMEFEGRKFFVTSAWETYLKNKFGNYMQLPPKSRRKPKHFIKIYKKEK